MSDNVEKQEKEFDEGEGKYTSYSSKKAYPDERAAALYFDEAKAKLFHVESWSNLEGATTAVFELYEQDGKRSLSEKVKVGDFVRILLPGPLPENWICVTDLKEEENFAEMIVRPSHDPTNSSQETEHFFKDHATSTFNVERNGNVIIAREIGKNEIINNQGDVPAGRSIINTLVATGGWAGFQRYQWEALTTYLADDKKKRNRK